MISTIKGMIAGLIATLVISAFSWLRLEFGVLPQHNTLQAQANFWHQWFGVPLTDYTGWISHYFIGTVAYGGIFGGFNRHLPCRTALGKAVTLMFAGWILALLVFLPLTGAGFLGLEMSLFTPVMMLVVHLIFAIIMGYSYAHLHHQRLTEYAPS